VADYLTFRSMIGIPVLIVFYYIGALVLPAVAWLAARWLSKRMGRLAELHRQGRAWLWSSLSGRQRLLVILLFVLMFLFMELIWRLMFEYLIAFMQMRDALRGG